LKEDEVPASAFLGGYSSIRNKDDMFNRKNSLFPNPKGSCETCIGDPPAPPAQQQEYTPEQPMFGIAGGMGG
jgi:hypothetical protein